MADARKANLLIISTSEANLPPGVQDWVSACVAGRHGACATLLFGEDGTDSCRLQFLRNTMEEAKLNFFGVIYITNPFGSCIRPITG